MESAQSGQLSSYISVAHANLAWLAWHARDFAEIETHASKALELCSPSHPFKSLSLWPLIGAAVAQNRVPKAIESVQSLFAPTQRCLPDALVTVLRKVLQTWQAGDERATRNQLRHAMELAQELRQF
jgi:hypothetical protein